MKILLIGSGGREHALALKINESNLLSQLFIAPGNAGTAECGENIPISDTNINELCDFALEKNIDLTIVGPEAPLVLGIVDLFESKGLKIIGPSKAGAQLEGSKEWAKALMSKYGIPTADYQRFDNFESSFNYVKTKNTYPIVIKADGLAAGKGVTVALDEEMAENALKECFIDQKFADAGHVVVIEDFLKGEEASIFAFTDGKTILPMEPAQDHKAIYDGDKGPNTGGMGAYCPAPIVTEHVKQEMYNKVFLPLLHAFQSEGISYKGIVFAGLMIDNDEPSIVEFNVRFGDPETQVVLPRLKNDILEIFSAIAEERLNEISLEWKDESSVCIVLAADGYPGSYEKHIPLTLESLTNSNSHIVHAGTTIKDDKLVTNGGRVLGVIGQDIELKSAINTAYNAINAVEFKDKYYRKDIGQKALK